MMAWIDERLGRVTMYRLVTYCLVALAGMAIILMVSGSLTYSPFLFILTTMVVVGVAYGSNRLFGWLFGVKPHGESAIITGLILSLLFAPDASVVRFIELALIAVIAMASKYILVIRGRHIFNPAAIAIVIGSISGLAYAGWWIATPGMIPLTIVVAVLLLRRTQKEVVGTVFMLVAISSLLIQGTDPVTALTSWPLLFVGAFMITEPLTLPPRAWQQYMMAGVVGLLMTIPFSYARITMTPALALVIGNVIGWYFGQRGRVKLRLTGKKQLGESTYEFVFDAERVAFEPGQYLELNVPHAHPDSRGQRRVFSIVASPGDETISIGMKIPSKPSTFKRALMNLKPGVTLYATRIAGDFVLPKNDDTPVVCIAGGIGITPFVSYTMSTGRPMTLIYAVHDVVELSFVDILKHHARDVTVVSRNEAPLPDKEWAQVNGALDRITLEKLLDVQAQPVVYISGPPSMVAATKEHVKRLGIKKVRVDEFSGY